MVIVSCAQSPMLLQLIRKSAPVILKRMTGAFCKLRSSLYLMFTDLYIFADLYIIPGAPAGIAGMGSLMLATAASVVRKLEATLVAF